MHSVLAPHPEIINLEPIGPVPSRHPHMIHKTHMRAHDGVLRYFDFCGTATASKGGVGTRLEFIITWAK